MSSSSPIRTTFAQAAFVTKQLERKAHGSFRVHCACKTTLRVAFPHKGVAASDNRGLLIPKRHTRHPGVSGQLGDASIADLDIESLLGLQHVVHLLAVRHGLSACHQMTATDQATDVRQR